jgi:8-amino-7-oxononanoate synthase
MRRACPPGGVAQAWAQEDLAQLDARGHRRTLEPLTSPQGPEITLGTARLVNFSSNDYLGLAADPRLGEAAAQAVGRHGMGSGASRLVVGDSLPHAALEAALARFMGADAALLFNAGYAANVGVLSSLVGPGDVIFSDALNHASLIDGCRLSRAQVVVYPHGDVATLDALLGSHPGRRRGVCTDAVFSMDGDAAPLRELVEVCGRHGAALVVDEAHAVGVFGNGGAGLCEALGVAAQVDLRVGTLGKALGGFGAFAVGASSLRELFIHRARSLVFSTALPPSVSAAAERALQIVEAEPARRERLWRNIHRFAEGLRRLGVQAHPRSPIFPVVLGDARAAVEASAFLRARGVLAKPIRPPTVPEGTSRLRFALSAGHTDPHLELALDALGALL